RIPITAAGRGKCQRAARAEPDEQRMERGHFSEEHVQFPSRKGASVGPVVQSPSRNTMSCRSIIRAGCLPALDGCKRTVDGKGDLLANKAHGAVRQSELESARMPTAEGVPILPVDRI